MEVNTKECYSPIKYINPKIYNFIKDEDKKNNIDFIVDDIKDIKMHPERDNIIYYKDGIRLLIYNKMIVVLWGCVQEIQKEIISLKSDRTKLKGKGRGEGKRLCRLIFLIKN